MRNCRHAQQTNCFATRHNRGDDQGPSRARYGERQPAACLQQSATESVAPRAGPQTELSGVLDAVAVRRALDGLGRLDLDVQLPGISGLDLQQELASKDIQIPIIFLTGHGDRRWVRDPWRSS